MVELSRIDQIFSSSGSNIPVLAQSCLEMIPKLFPDHSAVKIRILLNDLDFKSDKFQNSKIIARQKIRVPKKCKGKIEIHIDPGIEEGKIDIFLSRSQQVADYTANLFEEAIRNIPTTDITLNSEKRYQLLAENSVDAIWIMDPLLNFTYISPSVEQMTGYTVEEWVGTNLSQHATRKEFLKMAGQALGAMRNYKKFKYAIFTANMLRKDGSEVPVEIIGKLLMNERGFPIGLQGSTRDISDRISAEVSIKESQEKYLKSIESLYQGGVQLGQSLDLQHIYQNLHQIITEIMPCDGMIISSFDSQHELLVCEAMFHEGNQVSVKDFPPIPLEMKGKGTQSQVVHSGESLYLSDYLAHQRASRTSYYVDDDGIYTEDEVPVDEDITRSAILVPLKREGQVIGVIQVTSYRLDAYTQENLRFLEAFAPQVSVAITNAFLFEETQKARTDLLISLQGTVEMLARTVETRDPYTAGHQRRVADLACAIAEKMELDQEQVDAIHMASIIHDIGKINIPAEILSKPGKLNALEFELIKTHPAVAASLLKGITFPWPIAEIIHQHHEKMDGSGYPQGLSGDAISIEARILAVADIVEAMSSHRPYREAIGIDIALDQIKQDSGTKLDSLVVEACWCVFSDGFYFSNEQL